MTRFKGKPAIDPATNLLVKDGSGQVYAVTDTSFASPLEVTDTAGLPLATISTGPLGIHQDFDTVDQHLEVVWKSGPYTVTLESSEGIAAAAAASAAQPAADAAATATADALSSTFVAQADAETIIDQRISETPSVAVAVADVVTARDLLTQPVAAATYGPLFEPAPAAKKAGVTQGLYSRQPMGSFRALSVDPAVAGRVWGVSSGGVSFIDGDGTGARVDKSAAPSAQSGVQMEWTATHVFLVTSGSTSRAGQVWRSPRPDVNGDGLAWSKVFDLTGGTTTLAGGVDGGENTYFREQSFATDGTVAYVLEYGGTVTGGPSVYHCANVAVADPANILWTKRKTWANGKHGHGVRIIGGVPWVMLGDAGFTDLGLWKATAAAAGTWTKLSLYGEAEGGNTLYGINIHPVTIDGQPVVLTDNDTKHGHSVLVYNTQGSLRLPLVPLLRVPPPYYGTVRSLTMTTDGNLMWVQTGEAGAVAALDSVWISRAPYTEAVLLEAIPSANTFGTLGAPVESGPYVFFGAFRVTKEKFLGQ